MTLPIDKAERTVIPANLRRKAGIESDVSLTAGYENGAVMMSRNVPGPKIQTRGRRCVASPTQKDKLGIDLAALIEEERGPWPR